MPLDPALMALIKSAKNKYSRTSRSVKLKEGSTTLRIVSKPGTKFWAELGVHWIKTEKDGKPVAVVGCNDEVKELPCSICQAIDLASKAATDDKSLAIIKDWKMKKSVLVNAIVRSGADANDNPQVVELTPTAFGQIAATIELYANDPEAPIDILDLAKGVDFIVERMGKNLDTQYRVMVAPRSKPVNPSVLDTLVDLEAYIEKEFFRGDERKALTAISNMTGVSVGVGLAAPVAPGLLTGPSSTVEDAAIEESVVAELEAAPEEIIVEAPPPPKAAVAKPVVVAPKAPAPAAVAPKAAVAAPKPIVVAPPVAPAPVEAADTFNEALGSQAEVDAMLAELDGIAP